MTTERSIMQLKKEESDLGGCSNAALDLHTDALGKIQRTWRTG
jgi:uncharacterized protein (UPF0335 family)